MGLFTFKAKWRKSAELIEVEIDHPHKTVVEVVVTTSKQNFSGCMSPKEKSAGLHRVHLKGTKTDTVRITQTFEQTNDCFNSVTSVPIGKKKRKIFLFELGKDY